MIERLRALRAEDLTRLATAIRAGRLQPPYTALAIAHELGIPTVEAVASELSALVAEGMAPRHLALLLEAAVAEPGPLSGIRIVATGPETPGIDFRDTGAVVRELFGGAANSVLVIGYAVYQGRNIFRVLAERMDADPSIRVRMCLDVARPRGDTSHESEILGRFAYRFRTQEWPGLRLPEVFHDPRALEAEGLRRAALHAKCIVVDQARVFVSSANFTEAAQERNIEIGVLIEDPTAARDLVWHFDALAVAGHLRHVPGLGLD